MSKDPAFLFYPNDYIGGTMGMTFEEKGAYMELLMMQFNRGHMTTHMIGQTVGQLWDTIKAKFKEDANGLWYNERLEDEKAKRVKFTESRRNNKKGTNQHTKPTPSEGGHMTTHMEDVNEDVDVIKGEGTKAEICQKYYKEEFEKSIGHKMAVPYYRFVGTIFNSKEYKNGLDEPANHIISLPKQISFEQFVSLTADAKRRGVKLIDLLEQMINKPKYVKGNKSLYLTLNSWVKKNTIQGTNHAVNFDLGIKTNIGN